MNMPWDSPGDRYPEDKKPGLRHAISLVEGQLAMLRQMDNVIATHQVTALDKVVAALRRELTYS